MSEATLQNLTGVKLVDHHFDSEYNTNFSTGQVFSRETETRTYQCTLLDAVDEAPPTPLNIGHLAPFGLRLAGTIKIYAYRPDGASTGMSYMVGTNIHGTTYVSAEFAQYVADDGFWTCESRGLSRDYSLPLSTIYTETWKRRGPWRLFSDPVVASSSTVSGT